MHGISNSNYATEDIFNLFDYLYPIIGGNAAAHSLNLANPGMYQMSWNGSPTHSGNGVEFNGVNQWGNTGFNVSNRLFNDRHWSMYSDNHSGISGWNFGVWAGLDDNRTVGSAIFSGTVLRYYGLNNYTGPTALVVNKMLAMNLSGTTTLIYNNGAAVLTQTNTKVSPFGNVYLGMLNETPTGFSAKYGTAFRCKMFAFGASLTPSQHAALANATNALQTALSRA